MTDEELDQARADEARRLWCESDIRYDVALIAACLAREGWMPPPSSVDPDVLMVRKVLAAYYHGDSYAALFEEGMEDHADDFQRVLAAFRAEKKRQQEAGE